LILRPVYLPALGRLESPAWVTSVLPRSMPEVQDLLQDQYVQIYKFAHVLGFWRQQPTPRRVAPDLGGVVAGIPIFWSVNAS
jgi:hypothetical protein